MANLSDNNSTVDLLVNPSYSYQPLDHTIDEIRVLVVAGGQGHEPIQTSLKHISLKNPSHYETISYVWGDSTILSSILVDKNPLDVPASAEIAIRRMRAATDRTIWIDAVCINQNDLEERQHQVSLMGEVYTQTTRNLVWLGPSQPDTPAAIKAFDAMWSDILAGTDNLKDFSDVTSQVEFSRYSDADEFCPHDVGALFNFFSNTWFQRLWCVQEVALAASNVVLCGEFELPLLKILRVARWLNHKKRFTGQVNPKNPLNLDLVFVDEYIKNANFLFNLVDPEYGDLREIHPTLFHLLGYSMQFQTTQASDSVFAILGLLSRSRSLDNPMFQALIKPDYKKSFEDVARDATKATILEIGNLTILSYKFQQKDTELENSTFPSWVPRFDRRWDASMDASMLLNDDFDAYPDSLYNTDFIIVPILEAEHGGPIISVLCDHCDQGIDEYYHCDKCEDGNFDVCTKCKESGMHCHDNDHELIKRWITSEGIVMTSNVDGSATELEVEPSALSPNLSILHLQGIAISSVKTVSPIFTDQFFTDVDASTEQIRTIMDIIKLTDNPEDKIKIMLTAFARTITGAKASEDSEALYQTFLTWSSSIRKAGINLLRVMWTDKDELRPQLDAQKAFNDDVIKYCTNRRFFVTESGLMGLGPRNIGPTDIIVVVRGYSIPIVLRPNGELVAEVSISDNWVFETRHSRRRASNEPIDEFTFVGDCYVDGIMYGEAVEAYREQGDEEMIFKVK